MKKIVLERLTFRNFKGFREFVLSTKGGNTDVYGDNGTGKTTLFDGFIWLLFGKDSRNKSDFEIKELDALGKVRQHKLEHEVEGDLLINGRRKTFRRVFSEQWTKKRGALTSEFTGHTTSYHIDGVSVPAGEYKAEVDAIIKEDLFKLLTSPTFFNEQLKKDERRKVLLQICGNITDAEVIHSNDALERLPSILRDRDVDAHRKVVAARCKAINDEIKDIPIRISEAQRSQPDVTDLDQELLLDDIDHIRSQIKAKESELFRIQNGGESAIKEKRLHEIEAKLISIKNRLQSTVLDKVSVKRDEVGQLQSEFDALRRQIDDKQHRIKTNERTIDSRKQESERLRTDWTEVNGSAFVGHEHDENCPTCRQTLPQEQIQEAFQKAVASFNKSKSERLEQISAKGKVATEEARQLEQNNSRLTDEINVLTDKLASLQTDLTAAEAQLTDLRSGIQDPGADPEYQRLLEESAMIKQEITLLRDSAKETISKVQSSITSLSTDLRNLEEDNAKFAQVRKTEDRISVLDQQEKELASEYERLQEELFLTEEFTRTKVSLLDSKINSKFKYARFRLFDEQINGGLKEVCDTLFNGVPYGSGLNNAAEYNVGLDIINTLSEYYEVSVPIFFDNAESVTKLIDTDAQVIRLVVPPTFDSLPVETQEELVKLYGSYEEASAVWKNKNKQLRIETKEQQFQEAI
ncbi:AAA family ATPase [Paenibacillus sp. IHBB 10380]|uniref:AAA family ATPase n=1 Tax=Paenibacillus sp. IHBB 10380 TaxID=1566358 RepID=UPI0005CFE434|nr:AAA family ATPase [Paenibacillus sp. IHBB 10380]AJS59884.1 hypothetical protein UB51_16945 [Paenibacillus sp. IHBB 10380]